MIQRSFFYLFTCFALIAPAALADSIIVYNKTFRDLYVGIYYQFPKVPFFTQKPPALATAIQSIDAQSFLVLDRPNRWFGADRQLVFVEDQSLLNDTLTSQELDVLKPLLVGNLQGNSFYIATDDDGAYHGYTALEWNDIEQPWHEAQQEVLKALPAIAQNPYSQMAATVRTGNDLCDGEVACVKSRIAYIQQALAKTNSAPVQNIPNLSIICSGGGFRAMLYTVGALKGLQNTGILDLSTYLVGLSGSTWAIANWISSGISLGAFHDWLINNIDYNLDDTDENDFTLMEEVLLTKYCAGQPIGFVDMYGSFIANELFDLYSNNKIMVHLSDQAKELTAGQLPFPLYTCISAQNPQDEKLWYEFSPYEAGAPWLNAYVPTWAFGRKFQNGVSITNAPEQPMGTLLGTFGLAVGVTVEEMYSYANISQQMSTALAKAIVTKILADYGNDRPILAQYSNMVFGMADTIFNDQKIINIVDAGINCNLPYVPVSGQRPARKADILLVIDASAGTIGEELQGVQAYANANNLPFPPIDYTQIGQHAVSVFKDANNPAAPIVIYVPIVVDEQLLAVHQNDLPNFYSILHNFDIEDCINNGVCNTFNFVYTCEQARRITALGEFNAMMAHDAVLQSFQSLVS